ncbi:MAG: metallophosphoesterase [Desulfurococcaceae archaeon TW002]
MKILVISDIHDNLEALTKLKSIVLSESYDLVVVLGDFTSPFTLRELLSFTPKLVGVFGNNDGDKALLKGLAPQLVDQPLEEFFEGWRVFIMHGFKDQKLTEKIVYSLCVSGLYDIVLYGHTHVPKVSTVGKCLTVNPGTLSGYLAEFKSYAVLITSDHEATAKIIELESSKYVAEASTSREY